MNAESHQGWCFPSLGDTCGGCHRCQPEAVHERCGMGAEDFCTCDKPWPCLGASDANWVHFGTHANRDLCDYTGPVEFSDTGPDGLPDRERHGGYCAAWVERSQA